VAPTDGPTPTLYLIAHKVRGEPAFDVAVRMECPECGGEITYGGERGETIECCVECDSLGYWWIIPTSGHRAYPYWSKDLSELHGEIIEGWSGMILRTMPNNLPDHYTTRADPGRPKLSDLLKPKPITMNRRI
jgi:hypothetical protein